MKKHFVSINNGSPVESIKKILLCFMGKKWDITTEHCELNNIDNLQQKANELQAMGIIDIIDQIL